MWLSGRLVSISFLKVKGVLLIRNADSDRYYWPYLKAATMGTAETISIV
jgi:ABC-type phosphate transport system auxiliary subunit